MNNDKENFFTKDIKIKRALIQLKHLLEINFSKKYFE